ncbi:hypothetical protein GCM10009020_35590 [Natronoarchaeum mannanilyticum]|uniref:Uncharacterized protein n=1 Tax=Natronoarchaeum mannanilyticum TaxID=926360 RepID=A0AAV3TFF4_9EURY
MSPKNAQRESLLDLSREEQWVLHHVILDCIEMESRAPESTDSPALAVYRVFEKLERGTHRFSQRECQCIRDELRQYVDS